MKVYFFIILLVISLIFQAPVKSKVLVDFTTGDSVNALNSVYPMQFDQLGGEPPSIRTADRSGDVPVLSGKLTSGSVENGSFVITIEARNNEPSDWNPQTWRGGTAQPVNGSSSGLGIKDGGIRRVDTGEAILWTFELDLLDLEPGKSLLLTAASFANSKAELWKLTGTPGSSNAGTLISTGATWSGLIQIEDGDSFALSGDGFIESLTLELVNFGDSETPSGLIATSGVSKAILNWDEDLSNTLKEFKVYRSQKSPVTTSDYLSTIVSNQYEDETAAIGVTYYYAVSAVGNNDIESNLSSEASVVPEPPEALQLLDVATLPTSPLSVWSDQSGQNNNAAALVGQVTFPSSSLSKSGLEGVDFGAGRNSLKLFDAEESKAILDLSVNGDGFCIMIAMKCDSLVQSGFNDVLGNSTESLTGLQMGYTPDGIIQVRLGTELIISSGKALSNGDTVVMAFQYDANSETYELWDSKNYTSRSGPLSRANFSTDNPITLGSIDEPNQYLDGMVGEIRVFNSPLGDYLFKEVREKLLHRWVKPPNIVMLFVDDWAWNGSPILMDKRMLNSGMPGLVDMPNLERLANQGMIFRNAYASPQCGPSRVSLQTGQSNARNGFTVVTGKNTGYFDYSGPSFNPVLACTADNNIRPGTTTIPEALDLMGYQSAHIGKWHSGGSPADEGYVLHDGNTSNKEGNTHIGDETVLTGLTDPKLTGHITNKATRFIEESYLAHRPFYVQLSYYAMHAGEECFPKVRQYYQEFLEREYSYYSKNDLDPDNLKRKVDPAVWLGMAYELDLSFGTVLSKLDELGIAENTYIVMMSDNGFRHSILRNVRGQSQPLHMKKWWVWQGGIRVPMVAMGPGIPNGSSTTANVANYDLLPTFFEWAGGDPDRLQNIDGVSLKGLMEEKPQTESFLNRSLYFHYPHYRNTLPHSCVIRGYDKVMYFYETPLLFPEEDPIMLFDLANDPAEYHNIYGHNTETKARGDALYQDLKNYLKSVGARIPILNLEEEVNNFDSSEISESVADTPDNWQYFNASSYFGTEKASLSLGSGFFLGTRPLKFDETERHSFADYWKESWSIDIGEWAEDFDGDGDNNLVEYVFGGNPTDAFDSGYEPAFNTLDGSFEIDFRTRNDDSRIQYLIETSNNLENWTTVNSFLDSPQPNSTEFDIRSISIPMDEDKKFIRFRVNLQ